MNPLMTTTTPDLDHAISLANRALAHIPAYQEHVRAHGRDGRPVGSAREFEALPVTTKINYLRRRSLSDMVWNGDIAGAGTWSATSGSTGGPTFFPRDRAAATESVEIYGRILSENFEVGDRSTLVIVCFAMGTWIGGTYSYQAVLGLRARGHRVSATTPGIDVRAAVKNLSELAPYYEKVVIAGYPPLVKDVLDQAPESALAQDISILLAGEAITETWRDHVLKRIGRAGQYRRVCVMYGTAEAGVMGHETPLTIALRRAAIPGTELGKRLFGAESLTLPTFVEFNPMRLFTEVDADGHLLFTIDSTLPLIRYRINDTGKVFTGRELGVLLQRCPHAELAEAVEPDAGYIVLTGRPDVATTFYSSNIYPRDLVPAFENPSVANMITNKFRVSGLPDGDHQPVLRIDVELAAGVMSPGHDLPEELSRLCRSSLRANNEEFRALDDERDDDRCQPRITLYAYGTGPFGADVKQAYVVVA